MRHWMLSLVVLSALLSMVGCKNHPHMHGVCDCEFDDHCITRQPWLRGGAGPVHSDVISESIHVPATKLPEVRTKQL